MSCTNARILPLPLQGPPPPPTLRRLLSHRLPGPALTGKHLKASPTPLGPWTYIYRSMVRTGKHCSCGGCIHTIELSSSVIHTQLLGKATQVTFKGLSAIEC